MKTNRIKASLLALSVTAAALLSGCNSGTETKDTQAATTTTKAAAADTTTKKAGDAAPAETDAPAETPELEFKAGTVLRMATGYNNAKTGLSFDAETAGDGVTLANGQTYHTGDLKPTWVAVQDRLGFTIEDKYQGNSAKDEFNYWKEQMDQVDIVSGTASLLTENGADKLINIAEYLDKMPNFKAYLDANPIVLLSITGSTTGATKGAIYFSPYFDGVNDIERMPLMRVDWVQKLLDGDGEFTADACGTTAAPVYQPYMPTSGKVSIDTVKADGSGVETYTKDYDAAGNIVQLMNDKGTMSGVEAVNMLREYIDKAYGGKYGTTRSNLYCGQNAAWDADELVALLRCVKANAQTLNGTDSIQGIFSREDANNQRRVDMFRFAGTLFGVRGLESRQDYLYVGNDNKLHDARQEAETYVALEKMNAMAQEGLISESFMKSEELKTDKMLENDLGFMHYDYNQTQTVYNKTKLQNEDGEKYMAAMVPVARWNDGTGEQFMRFTESWRSVKTDGWGISKAGVGSDTDKLNAALKLIDYAYSFEGQILMSYGPDEFIKTKADGSFETFSFNGVQMPVIADATYAELWEKASGNYTNYARCYLGSTLSFAKSQAFEYQCTHEVGKEGAGYISTAIGLGTIKHPELALTSNPWYTSVPTVLPNTSMENTTISGYTELSSSGKFSSSKDQENMFVDIIVGGYSAAGTTSAETTASLVADDWSGKDYLAIKDMAWQRLVDYYKSVNG